MVIVKHMKKLIILIAVVLILLVAYLVLNKKQIDAEGNQASVISNLFSKNKNTDTKPTGSSSVESKPVIQKFNIGNQKQAEDYLYSLKKQPTKGGGGYVPR